MSPSRDRFPSTFGDPGTAPDEGLRRFLLEHKFGMEEVLTKLQILQDEYTHLHEHNPIEHVSSRVKSLESLADKMERKGIAVGGAPTYDEVRARVTDIAGVRVTCSFVSDVYRVFDVLSRQPDLRVVEVRDYVREPKPNGYRSLHALLEVPVFLSEGTVPVTVETQFRTVAMDFWASLEHKIDYKFDQEIPAELLNELTEAAELANNLDLKMERIHREVRALRPPNPRLRTQTDEVIHPEALLLGALFPNGREPGHGDTTDEPSR